MKISELNIFPIKSCKGFSVSSIELDAYGIVGDRRMMIVDQDGIALTQRDFHELCFVEPTLSSDTLSLKAPGMDELKINTTDFVNLPVSVETQDDACVGLDCGSASGGWFSEYLRTACKLVRMDHSFVRPINRKYSTRDEHVSFTDGFPMLLISEASLADLNSRLIQPITMNRFRPNIVVKGCAPFDEDRWKTIDVAGLTFEVVKPCARCVVTTIDPTTGKSGDEPLRTLATFRKTAEGKVMFGQNVIHVQKSGTIRIGDEVTIVN
jgi:hypothetical protein